MAITDKDVQIHLPLENLIDTVCRLPLDDLKEVKRRIDERLQNAGAPEDPLDALEDKEFWDSELGREIMSEADLSITREEVFKATSSIKDSLAAAVRAERDER